MLGHRSLNVEDYLTILKRRWWIIAIPAILLPILAVGATYFIPPDYESSSLVLIDQQKNDYVKALVAQPLDSRLAYMMQVIESRTSIEPIIKQYNLYGDQHLSMDARVDLTRKAILVEAVQSEIARSNGLPGFKITFKANDPHTAQQVCAQITSMFTSENLKSRQTAADDQTQFLQARLDEAKRNLDDQDKKIADFQRQNLGALPGDEGNNVGTMSSLTSRLDATTQNILQLQQNKSVGEALLNAQLAQVPSTSGTSVKAPQTEQKALDDLENLRSDLLTRYTTDYPEVKEVDRKIADVRAEMAKAASAPPPSASANPAPSRQDSPGIAQLKASLHALDVQITQKQQEQNILQRQIQGYEGKIQATPQVAEQFKALTRDSETDQTAYNSLRAQMNQSQATTELEHRQQGETFTLLDEANLPLDPTFPKPVAFGAGGVGAGLVLGLLIVALLEYKDTALRTEREVWDFTHLPTLAVIAWSGDPAETTQQAGRLKRMFRRKPPKDVLADARG